MASSTEKRAEKARKLWRRWQLVWNDGCSSCDFDEAEGEVINHCRECTREMALIAIAADLPKLLKRRATT